MKYVACPDIDPKVTIFSRGRSWYHESISFKDTLVITAGDSWTWGDSLGTIDSHNGVYDCPTRVTNIYGNLLSKKLDADFINVGICGGANINIQDNLIAVLESLKIKYKKIYVVITLTENCREANWDNIWQPTATDSLENFLKEYERRQFESLKQNIIDNYKNVNVFIARNFTYSFNDNLLVLQDTQVPKTWVDILASYQNNTNYPNDLRLMSSIAYVPLHKCLRNLNLYRKFKFQFMEHYAAAELAMEWLESSSLNYKKATKHPTELGHQIWADYLYDVIKKTFSCSHC